MVNHLFLKLPITVKLLLLIKSMSRSKINPYELYVIQQDWNTFQCGSH